MLLTPERKAVSEEDARAVLRDTCALAEPLGIPTVFFRPSIVSDVQPARLLGVPVPFSWSFRAAARVKEAIAAQFATTPYPDDVKGWMMAKAGRTGRALGRIERRMNVAACTPNPREWDDSSDDLRPALAHTMDPESYREPRCNIIYCPRDDFDGAGALSVGLKIQNPVALPGSPAQWQAQVVWHEIAHGTGAGEPQADKISAIMFRRLFEETALLDVLADFRAVRAVFKHGNRAYQKNAGWTFVDALDAAIAMPQAEIDAMDETDIKALRFERYPDYSNTMNVLGRALRDECGAAAFDRRDLACLMNAASALSAAAEPEESRILDRFSLAAARLARGVPAYVAAAPVP